MSEKEALAIARRVLAPYRRGPYISSGAGDITRAVADAIWKVAAKKSFIQLISFILGILLIVISLKFS